ncbi:hypothetical protein GGI43DRAFT_418571 [Trichoderma evansii]
MSLIKVLVCLTSFFRAISTQTPDPQINTPSGVVFGLPVQLTFGGTSPPFIITVLPGGQAEAAPLTTVGTFTANAATWVPNLPPGGLYTLLIRDSLGRTNPSGQFSIAPAPATTLVTTTDSAGSNFTITGVILISGTSSTTVPCRTVITTNTAGVAVTSTETGSSVLPTQLQRNNTESNNLTPPATASSSPTASPILTAGAGMPDWSNAVLVSVGLSGFLTLLLVLL